MLNPPPNPPPKGGGLKAKTDTKFARRSTTKNDIERARRLRREMAKTERYLWNKLRDLPGDLGLTFRRQHPVHPYILDFACIKAKLAIELDGESHNNRKLWDQNRARYITHKGYLTLRFPNEGVLENIETVLEVILREASKRSPPKTLPPWGEGWEGGDAKILSKV